MAVSTILPDELVAQIVGVGEVDVLVGLPTLNHAETVELPVRAAHAAFHRELARERTVLLNVDGGSSDGTPDRVRNASIETADTLLTSHSLRTHHRITAPYHGVPGKPAALRAIFAAADLLQARAVAVLDPEVVSVTPESIAALVRPVLAGQADYVSPAYARHPLDGALVTQVVRPLFGAAFGLRLSEPLAGELGCSAAFAERCLAQEGWDGDELRLAIDLWLSGVAAVEDVRVVEVALGRRRLSARQRPGIAELLLQVLAALFTTLRLHERRWLAREREGAVPLVGRRELLEEPAALDAPRPEGALREDLHALAPILEHVLKPATLDALRRAATSGGGIGDPLWAAVLVELALSHRAGIESRGHLTRAAVPLYLARVDGFVSQMRGSPLLDVERRLEALCLELEWLRPELVGSWPAR
jgi:hypothetical protein